MSVTADHRTVSLWPLNPPASSGPARPRTTPAPDPLAAITSRYRRGRDGIIAGESAPPAVATPLPTVPVALLPQAERPGVPQPPAAEPDGEATTFWSRLARRRPSPRGRHSPKT